MKPTLLCLFLLFSISTTFAKQEIDELEFVLQDYDKIKNENFRIGFKVHLTNGRTRTTSGYLNGNFSLKKFQIESEQITKIIDDVIWVDHKKIRQNNHLLELDVLVKHRGITKKYIFTKEFPRLDSFYFSQNSISAYQKTPLLIAGDFSNGKTYYLSNKKEYPGFKFNDFIIEAHHNVALTGLNVYYNPSWSEMVKEIPLCLSYERRSTEYYLTCNYGVTLNIKRTARNGENGPNGASGKDASESGYTGGSGEDGWNAGHGENAKDLFVFVAEYQDYYLCWFIQDTWSEKYAISREGKVKILNLGGNGGKGGTGGQGGDGGDGTEDYDPGDGGNGGNGGKGGDGGDGGNIIVYHDIDSVLIKLIVYGNTNGGKAGRGGPGGKGGKNGYDYESEGLGGLLSILIRGRGSKGKYGKSGKSGKEGSIKFACMNSEEYQMIHETFEIDLSQRY